MAQKANAVQGSGTRMVGMAGDEGFAMSESQWMKAMCGSDVRAERVLALRAQIAAGTYSVGREALANAMLQARTLA